MGQDLPLIYPMSFAYRDVDDVAIGSCHRLAALGRQDLERSSSIVRVRQKRHEDQRATAAPAKIASQCFRCKGTVTSRLPWGLRLADNRSAQQADLACLLPATYKSSFQAEQPHRKTY